jgi:carnitine-CoA ligase
VGATGEIVVKCEPAGALMDGYWRDPAATAAALAGGWLHTGDLARREADGSYYFVGRLKEVIKRSGENIGAQEVESALIDHPGISEVAVIGVPDPYRDEAVMAVIVAGDGTADLTLPGLRQFCEGRLATFKMPTLIWVVDELPKGMLGKVDKKLLKQRVAAGEGPAGVVRGAGGAS